MTGKQIVKILNESPLSYRWSWVERMFNKKYFFRNGTEDSLPIIKKLIELLDSNFGDKWCFHFYTVDDFPDIWIHFPEFTITNSNGNSHNIKDLFVVLKTDISEGSIKIKNHAIQGFRTSLTDKEYISKYQHSHLYPTGDYFTCFQYGLIPESSFCLGTSEIGDLLQIINGEPFDEGVFELFLILLRDVFKWESLEGHPYISMIQISSYKDSSKTYTYDTSILEQAISCILRNPYILKSCNYSFVDGGVKVSQNTPFINSLKTLFIKNGYNNLLCTVSEDKYRRIEGETIMASRNPNKHVLFRGYKIPLRIINTCVFSNSQDDNITKYTIYPPLLDKVMLMVNTEINKKITKYYDKRRKTEKFRKYYCESSSEEIGNAADTISMQYNQFC